MARSTENPFLLIPPTDTEAIAKYVDTRFDPWWRRKEASWRVNNIRCNRRLYVALLAFFEGRCGICGVHWTVLGRLHAADHSHTTGEVRGILCGRDNYELGRCEVMEGLGVKTRLSRAQRGYLARCKRFRETTGNPLA